MLVMTSVLLLAAVGFLVVALVTGPIWMAWLSIAASGAAALTLVVRAWRRRNGGRHRAAGEATAPAPAGSRRRKSASTSPPVTSPPVTSPPEESQPATSQPEVPEAAAAAPATTGPATPGPGAGRSDGSDAARHEPIEEDTDAADLLLVCELDDEVVVVDERPRYHLAGCRWLGTRPTEALPVKEARELGFTPCVSCGPDAELARRHRAASAR